MVIPQSFCLVLQWITGSASAEANMKRIVDEDGRSYDVSETESKKIEELLVKIKKKWNPSLPLLVPVINPCSWDGTRRRDQSFQPPCSSKHVQGASDVSDHSAVGDIHLIDKRGLPGQMGPPGPKGPEGSSGIDG
ncbi:hypothetical protein BSL78_06167 [Apostichopus japonicus]|uniref:Uncharacterized protein n=1 Tax=Stichopus japonicus TaxID=307972 RepID=A0A2G8L9I6_STIJA|nr:hypothetical protein BSL78_06167 [Apostichopus japonicus]